MRIISAAAAMLLAALPLATAHAGPVLDRVKQRGAVRCGSTLRPGLADAEDNGALSGVFVDMCRAIAIAVLGPSARVEYHGYESSVDFDAVRNGEDDVFFLTASEMTAEHLPGKVVPGPVVFYDWYTVMVPERFASDDIAGTSVCFMTGSGTQRNLEAYVAARHLDIIRMPFTEDVEMNDAYNVQHCRAVANEATTLAEVRLRREPTERIYKNPAYFTSRFLPQPLAILPIFATTGTADASWSAIVAWTVLTVERAETPDLPWVAPGAAGLPIEAPELGLENGWQKRVVETVGSYADIYRRRLGEGSDFKLPRGPNAPWTAGGLFVTPFVE